MKPTTHDLRTTVIAAVRAGRVAAESVRNLDASDGGSCNFDDVAMQLPRWVTEDDAAEWLEHASGRAGAGSFRWFGKRCWLILCGSHGQADLRTRCRDAFLQEARTVIESRGHGQYVTLVPYNQLD